MLELIHRLLGMVQRWARKDICGVAGKLDASAAIAAATGRLNSKREEDDPSYVCVVFHRTKDNLETDVALQTGSSPSLNAYRQI